MGLLLRRSLLLCLLLLSQNGYAFQCRDFFTITEQPADFQTISEITRLLETDREVLFPKYQNFTIDQFLKMIFETQKNQLQLIENGTLDLPAEIALHFRALLRKSFQDNAHHLENLREDSPLLRTKISELSNPQTPELKSLQAHVIQFMTTMNTVFAEFLAAAKYPTILKTESNVPELSGSSWTSIESILRKSLTEQELANFKTRQMDLVVQNENRTLWLEVKYLGRHKEYAQASGSGLVEKFTLMKQVADMLPERPRIVLVIVGPGRLKQLAIKQYEDIGIEVLHITYDWHNKSLLNLN
jgi:hypothetical protein